MKVASRLNGVAHLNHVSVMLKKSTCSIQHLQIYLAVQLLGCLLTYLKFQWVRTSVCLLQDLKTLVKNYRIKMPKLSSFPFQLLLF